MTKRTAIPIALSLVLGQAAPATARGSWTWPVRGEVITPYRNGDDPYARGQHRGIDIAAREGTTVVAATAGSVRFAGVAGSSGLTVSVRTADGRFDTSYLHLSSVEVRDGQRVPVGERLGAVGTTGRRSAAEPHLHFGVREAGTRHAYRDPLDFLRPPPPAAEPERPRGVPAPAGIPVRTAPRPEPVWAHRVAPLPRRRRAPAKRRFRLPERSPRGAPALRPAPHSVQVGRTAPAPAPTARPSPARAPALGTAPLPALRSQPAGPAAMPDRLRHPAHTEGGPDVGWVLACVGLLLAAACIGRPSADEPKRRGRAALTAILRPLTGRG